MNGILEGEFRSALSHQSVQEVELPSHVGSIASIHENSEQSRSQLIIVLFI